MGLKEDFSAVLNRIEYGEPFKVEIILGKKVYFVAGDYPFPFVGFKVKIGAETWAQYCRQAYASNAEDVRAVSYAAREALWRLKTC